MSVDKSMDDNKIKEKIKFLWNEIKCNIIGLFYYFPLHLAVFTGIAFSLITFQLLDSFFFYWIGNLEKISLFQKV